MMIKSLRTAAATLMTAVSAFALTVLGPTGTASAGVLDVTCTPPSSHSGTYTPPMTVTPQDIVASNATQYGPCVSLSNPAITSGTSTATGLAQGASCLDLLQSAAFATTITWNTGQTSTISFNYTATVVGAVLVATNTGTVTSGLFTGSTVLQVFTSPATDVLLCNAGLGTVSSTYALVTLEITSL